MSEEITGNNRDYQGKFKPGESGNLKGRPIETKEEKDIRKASRELVQDYKDKLAEALPKISPALIRKATTGDIPAIKELNDRVMGRPVTPVVIADAGQSFMPSEEEKEKVRKALEELE